MSANHAAIVRLVERDNALRDELRTEDRAHRAAALRRRIATGRALIDSLMRGGK